MSYSILVVDDSPLARKIVRRTLEVARLEVGAIHEAANGRDALALLDEHWIDAVFADINMPEMDGRQMIEQMAASELLASIPVIVISSDRCEARMEYLLRLGVRAYLTKPLTPEAVRDVLDEVLRKGPTP